MHKIFHPLLYNIFLICCNFKNAFTYWKSDSTELLCDIFPWNRFFLIFKWFPTIGQHMKVQKAAITAKYFTTMWNMLIHLFLMHPFSTPWKHQKTLPFSCGFLMFSVGIERVHWERMSSYKWFNAFSNKIWIQYYGFFVMSQIGRW